MSWALVGAAIAVAESPDRLGRQLLVLGRGEDGRGWQVEGLQQRSALEKLQQLLQAGQWDAGMLLAESHGLDPDIVRK